VVPVLIVLHYGISFFRSNFYTETDILHQFYSEAILCRRGPLAKVWLAAHMERKLSKTQTLQADIEQSVGELLALAARFLTTTDSVYDRCYHGTGGRGHGTPAEWTAAFGRRADIQSQGKIFVG